jgi:hypothetical protein
MLSRRVNYIRPVIFWGMSLVFAPAYLLGQDIRSSSASFTYDSVFVSMHKDFTADIRFSQKINFEKYVPAGYSSISIQINKYITLDDISVTTDLPDGRSVALENTDIQTVSDFGPQYYPDSKTKIIPLTLVREQAETRIDYKLHYSCLLYLPDLIRQRDIPTTNSYLEIQSEIPFRYYSSPGKFQISNFSGVKQFFAAAIPARFIEENSPVNDNYRIFIRPDSFLYDGQKYASQSWSDIALFYNSLAFPEESQNKLIFYIADSLSRTASDKMDTLESLYSYVRDNIRYVSADIGRGDFKPLRPIQIINRKIGDCKDQSALLIALIRSLGVAAFPGLVTTIDKPGIIDSLAWPGYFDHVIAIANTDRGLQFFDPSQQSCCFGKLPISIRGRPILICRSESPMEPSTPPVSEEGNTADISLTYKISDSGEISCHIRLALYRDLAFAFYDNSPEKSLLNIQTGFFKNLPVDQYRNAFRLENQASDLLVVSGDYNDKLQTSPGAKGVVLKILSPSFDYLKQRFSGQNRQTNFRMPFPFRVKETTVMTLPDNFRFADDSTAVEFNECGMQYFVQAFSKDKTCRTYKYFQLAGYILPAECYNSFILFLPKAIQAISRSTELIPGSRHVEKKSP